MARAPYNYGAQPLNRGFRPNYGNRPGGFRRDGHRRAYISPYWPTYSYGYPWVWPGYPTVLDYDDYDSNYGPVADYGNQSPENQGYDNQGYGPDYGPDYGPVQPPASSWPSLGPYAPHPDAAQVSSSAAPSTEEAVTLIFKDGRSPQQIHNYVLTPTILYAGDIAHRQVIPITEIDVSATEKANAEAGVDFHLPQLQVRTVPNPGLPDTHVINPQ